MRTKRIKIRTFKFIDETGEVILVKRYYPQYRTWWWPFWRAVRNANGREIGVPSKTVARRILDNKDYFHRRELRH